MSKTFEELTSDAKAELRRWEEESGVLCIKEGMDCPEVINPCSDCFAAAWQESK